MKRFFYSCVTVFVILIMLCSGQSIFAQEAEEESKTIGITAGVEYMSNYLWRGTTWYNNTGAFFPSIAYEVLDTGLTVSIAGELSEVWLGDQNESDDLNGRQATDFGLDYSKSIAKTVTIGVGVWYFMMWDSENSFLTGTVSVTIDSVPLSPTLTYNHDYYTDSDAFDEQAKDFYIQLGISHEFSLTKDAALGLGLSAGYYNVNNTDQSGISDITTSVGLEVKAGAVLYSGSFNYVIVPGADFTEDESTGEDDIHRFYAAFGASYSI